MPSRWVTIPLLILLPGASTCTQFREADVAAVFNLLTVFRLR